MATREQYEGELLKIEERKSIEEAARAKEIELAARSKQLRDFMPPPPGNLQNTIPEGTLQAKSEQLPHSIAV